MPKSATSVPNLLTLYKGRRRRADKAEHVLFGSLVIMFVGLFIGTVVMLVTPKSYWLLGFSGAWFGGGLVALSFIPWLTLDHLAWSLEKDHSLLYVATRDLSA
jgi:hypothetical protein